MLRAQKIDRRHRIMLCFINALMSDKVPDAYNPQRCRGE